MPKNKVMALKGPTMESKERGKHINKLEKEIDRIKKSKRRPARLHRADQYAAEIQQNSDAWVNSLFEPFVGAQHFPETAVEGTDITSLHLEGIASGAVTVGSDSVSSCVFYAGLKRYRECATSAVALNNVTYDYADHPKLASLDPLLAGYRVTAMGFRIFNRSPLLNRNGRLFIGRLPPIANDNVGGTSTNVYDFISQSTEVQCIDLAQIPDEGLEVFWLPLTTQGYVEIEEHISTARMAFTALGYKDCLSNVCDNRIFFFAVSDAANPAELFYDHIMNLEFIPHTEDQYLFEQRSVIGAPEGVAESFLHHAVAAKKAGLGDMLKTGVKGALNAAWGSVKSFMKSQFHGGIKQVAKSVLADFALPAVMLANPHGRLQVEGRKVKKLTRSMNEDEQKENSIRAPLPRRRGSVQLDDWETTSDAGSRPVGGPRTNAPVSTPRR